jgi:peptide/nickel transport system substrate-binding protein
VKLHRWTCLALFLLAACYERGGKRRPVARDAGAPVSARLDAGSPTDTGWLVREPDGPADPAATVTIALEAEPVSLDPFATADASAARVLGDVYEGLLCAAPGAAPEPCLAERWEASLDGKTWRFWLRRGVVFHDGSAVRAADVLASFRAPGRGAAATGPLAAVLDDLVSITSPRAGEVVLRFAGARGTRARDLSMVPIAPAARIAARDLGARPVGTGPLAFTAWRRGEAIELMRWPRYWGEPARATLIRHRITADRAEAVRLLAAGGVDVVVQVPLADALAAATGGIARFRYEQPAFLAAIYNARRPALATADARRGLTALLDRPGVAVAILGGARVPSGPWPPGTREADPQVEPVPFDRALAIGLLGGARPTAEILVPQGSTSAARIADIWVSDAGDYARLRVTSLPYADLLGRLAAGDFDIAITSMSGGPDVDLWSRLSSKAPPSEAWCGLADPQLDALLEAHRNELDPDVRPRHARAVHRRLAELDPMAFIAVDTRAGLARAGVGGLGGIAGPPRARGLWKRAP